MQTVKRSFGMVQEYSIEKAIEELNVAKSTLYYRINKCKKELGNNIYTKKRKTFISAEGIVILKSCDSPNGYPNDSPNSSDCRSDYKDSSNDYKVLDLLKNENEFLKGQIDFLKDQILERDREIQTLSKLVENSQVLLQNEQQARMLLPAKENVVDRIKKWFTHGTG
jgi:hypothetical protein